MAARRLLVLLLVPAVVCHCGAGGEPRVRAPRRTSLAVLHAGPTGAVAGQPVIQVVFDRPIVPTGMTEARPGTILVQPTVPGSLHAVGSAAIVLVPDAPLPRATRFRVEIPEGVLANDGTALEEAVRFELETARPHLVEMIPERELEGLPEDQPFLVSFDQPVDPRELARRARFEIQGASRSVDAAVVADPGGTAYLRVTPATPLPGGAAVDLVIDGALVGTEGRLSMGADVRRRFTVHGAPGLQSLEHVRGAASSTDGASRAEVALATPMTRGVLERSLRVEPPARIVYPEDEPRVHRLALADLRPSTRYRVVLAAGAADVFGQTLAADAFRELQTPRRDPAIRPMFDGFVLPPGLARALPFEAVNVPRASLRLDRLGPRQIANLLRATDPLPGQLAFAAEAPLAFDPRADSWTRATASLEPIVGARPGVFAWSIDENPDRVAPLLLTDLDVYARWSARAGVVWVTSMSTGVPAGRARVEVRDEQGRTLGVLQTDDQGLASIPPSLVRRGGQGPDECFLMVSRDDDLAFVHGPTQRIPETRGATVFTDQHAYARGGTVRIGGLVRGEPAGPHVLVQARGQGGGFGPVRTSLTAAGTFDAALRIPSWVPSGSFVIEATDPRSTWSATTPIEVRAPASAPSATVELGRDLYLRGQTAIWQVRAAVPPRGTLPGAAVDYRVVGRPMPFSPPGWETFSFAGADGEGIAVLARGSGALGDDGAFADSVRLTAPGTGPMRVRIEADVAGAGRALAETWAHPAALYAGLRLAGAPDAGGNLVVDVVAAEPSGRAVPRVAVRVEAVRRRFVSTEHSGGPTAEDLGPRPHCRATTGDRGGSCTLRLAEPGIYLVTATAEDARGNRAIARAYALREGPGDVGDAVPPEAALVTASARIEIGRSARLLVASPFDQARALLLVGDDGALGARVIDVRRGVSGLDVPVAAAMLPSAPVHLYLVGTRGRVVEGSTRVFVSSAERALRVDVEPDATQKSPGDRLELRLRVAGSDGTPVSGAQLTVAVAEQGSGPSIDGEILVAPAERPDAPATRLALRPDVVRKRSRARPVVADTDPAEVDPPPAAAGTTTYWNGGVTTDPDGSAVVRLDLPDRSGGWSIVAVAIARGHRAGVGRARVSTAGGVTLQPRVVPSLRVGDETTAVLTAVNDGARPAEVDVVVASERVAIRPPLAQHLTVPAGGTADARFELSALRAGAATISIRGADAGEALVPFDVGLGGEQEVRLRSGRLDGRSATIDLHVPGDAAADVGGLSWTLALYPGALATSVAHARIEPGRDDTTSLFAALVARGFLAKNARRAGDAPPADNADRATDLVRRILTRLDAAGQARHFATGPAQLDLGAWAGIALAYSRSAGLPVPRRVPVAGSFSTSQAPLAIWARRLQGLPIAPPGRRSAGPPAIVDAALRLIDGAGEERDVLLGALTSAKRPAPEGGSIVAPSLAERRAGVSAVRTTALAILGMIAARRPLAETRPLVRGLLGLREVPAYRSAGDAALALMAFDASMGHTRGPLSASVRLLVDGAPVAAADLSGDGSAIASGELSIALLLAARRGALEISRRGSAPVFWDLAVRHAGRASSDEPEENGLAIERVYERPTDVPQGQMPERPDRVVPLDAPIRVHLRVATGLPRGDVVIEDVLPAGCVRIPEAAPPASSPFQLVEGSRPDRAELYAADLPAGIHQISYLARAVWPGRFFAPGAEVEVLGRTDLSGRSRGDVLVVEGR